MIKSMKSSRLSDTIVKTPAETPMKKKLMDDYNYHDWTSFMVRKVSEKPKGPHFAAVLFEKESRYEHDHYTGAGSSSQHDTITYFAFPDKETLGEWVLRATKDKKQFFFFEVKKLGEATVKVDVDLGV